MDALYQLSYIGLFSLVIILTKLSQKHQLLVPQYSPEPSTVHEKSRLSADYSLTGHESLSIFYRFAQNLLSVLDPSSTVFTPLGRKNMSPLRS